MVAIIFAIVIIVIIALFIIQRFRRNIPVAQRARYTWMEILNPFNTAPLSVYHKLSPENKGNVWSIIGSLFVAIITGWLGFSVQYMMINQTISDKDRIAHYEVVDKIYPIYESFLDSCNTNSVMDTLFYYTAKYGWDDNDASAPIGLQNYLENPSNWNAIIGTAEKSLKLTGKAKRYFSNKNATEIESNNRFIIIGVQIYKYSTSNVLLDSISFIDNMTKTLTNVNNSKYTGFYLNTKELSGLTYSYTKALRNYSNLISNTANLTQNPILDSLMQDAGLNDAFQSIKIDMDNKIDNIDKAYCTQVQHYLISLIIQPLISNLNIINSELSASDAPNYISRCLIALVICIYVGYICFRIILMKFFNLI